MSKIPQRRKEIETVDQVKIFYGELPLEVVEAIKILNSNTFEDMFVRQIISLAISYIQMNKIFESDFHSTIMSVANSNRCHAETMFTGLYILIQEVIRSKIYLEVLKTDLSLLEIPDYAINHILHSISTARPDLEQKASSNAIGFPKLSNMRWRVDVVNSSSDSNLQTLRPSITMQIELDDGTLRTFEVSLTQFHQLRHGIAKTLAEMQRLERHPIVRIVEELEKRDAEDRNRLR